MKDESWVEKIFFGYLDYGRRREVESFYAFAAFCILAIVGSYVAGFGFLIWFIFKQIRLERNYYERYGQNWQEEYQKYHGSLAHAHLKIIVCVLALFIITLIGIWFYRQSARRRSKHSRH
jgi:H+/gluconate symporter-like permease